MASSLRERTGRSITRVSRVDGPGARGAFIQRTQPDLWPAKPSKNANRYRCFVRTSTVLTELYLQDTTTTVSYISALVYVPLAASVMLCFESDTAEQTARYVQYSTLRSHNIKQQ